MYLLADPPRVSRRRLRFVYAQTAGMLASILALVLFDAFSLEAFFTLSLMTLLVTTELTDPIAVTPEWRRRIWVVALAGLAAFGYVIAQQV